MVEPAARFEPVKIPLADSAQGLSEVSGVLGVPRWWPTGARVSICIAHGATRDHTDPVIESLHAELTERRYLTLRFNFPFAEAQKRRPDPIQILRRTFRAAIDALSRDPRALRICLDAWETVERLGSPEGELALAQAVVFLACAAKSNAVYKASKLAAADARDFGSLEVPMQLRNAPTKLMKELGYGES